VDTKKKTQTECKDAVRFFLKKGEKQRIIWFKPKIKEEILVATGQKKYILVFAFLLYHFSLSRLS
jgi:hypothetical protein